MPYPIPNEHERRALFAWLKQASSLTAWRRLYSYHQAFVDVMGDVYKQEQQRGGLSTIPAAQYARVLSDHDAFAASLDRLQNGDRRCFDYLGARGHFTQGLLSAQGVHDMYLGEQYGRNGFDLASSPRWPEIKQALDNCLSALTDIGVVLQQRHTDVPAPIWQLGTYFYHNYPVLIKALLQRDDLPEVPLAEPEVLVATGSNIPCYGIWEPVQTTNQQDMLSKLRFRRPQPGEVVAIDGCMNYLHADAAAPTIAFPEDGQRREGRPTVWRLLWKDDRYGKNGIPDEEKDYVFVQPVEGETLFRD